MDIVIQIENAGFSFDGYPVLEDVSLIIHDHEYVGIIGPNGGGKTTLLRLILGLIQPTTGRVSLMGKPPAVMRSRCGYVPQYSPADRRFPITVKEVVSMGLAGPGSFTPWHPHAVEDRVHAALNMVNIGNLAGKRFGTLSEGQRQRTLIARALVSEPGILLLDEPTASVDSTVEKGLYDLLRTLNERMTILLVSHDLGLISSEVGTVVCINRRAVVHRRDEMNWESVVRDTYHADMTMLHHSCGL